MRQLSDEVYRTDEVAAILKVNRSTVVRLVDRGRLKAIDLNNLNQGRPGRGGRRMLRIRREDLEAFLRKDLPATTRRAFRKSSKKSLPMKEFV